VRGVGFDLTREKKRKKERKSSWQTVRYRPLISSSFSLTRRGGREAPQERVFSHMPLFEGGRSLGQRGCRLGSHLDFDASGGRLRGRGETNIALIAPCILDGETDIVDFPMFVSPTIGSNLLCAT
jgi:hypothetical protein